MDSKAENQLSDTQDDPNHPERVKKLVSMFFGSNKGGPLSKL
jgi:hypothetical protein